MKLFAAALTLFALLFAFPARAAFTPPPLTGHIVDTAGKLSADESGELDRKLERIRQRTGFDIVAFVTGSLEGEEIEDVAYKAYNAWKLGQKGADNGVLLVIAPAERRVRIETGKGAGGALTDLQTNDIIRNNINPLLQQDRFYEAIDQGTKAIARTLVEGTPGNEPPKPEARAPPSLLTIGVAIGLGLLVIILAIVSPTFRSILFFFLLFGRGGGGGFGGGGGGIGRGGSSGGGGSSDSY
jgi:uncharacterized protein